MILKKNYLQFVILFNVVSIKRISTNLIWKIFFYWKLKNCSLVNRSTIRTVMISVSSLCYCVLFKTDDWFRRNAYICLLTFWRGSFWLVEILWDSVVQRLGHVQRVKTINWHLECALKREQPMIYVHMTHTFSSFAQSLFEMMQHLADKIQSIHDVYSERLTDKQHLFSFNSFSLKFFSMIFFLFIQLIFV